MKGPTAAELVIKEKRVNVEAELRKLSNKGRERSRSRSPTSKALLRA